MHEEYVPEYIDEDDLPPDDATSFRSACAFCRGTGVHPATMKDLNHKQCPVCQSKGVLEFNANRRFFEHCSYCNRLGHDPQSVALVPCPKCKGYGRVPKA